MNATVSHFRTVLLVAALTVGCEGAALVGQPPADGDAADLADVAEVLEVAQVADTTVVVASAADAAADVTADAATPSPVCPGSAGCPCTSAEACASGVCLPSVNAGSPVCAQPCPPPCPTGAACTAVGLYSVCVPKGVAPCAPVAESCNGLDDDCDGTADNGACEDGNTCTNDACNAANALCSHDLAKDGSPCSDDNPCTLADGCLAGACQPGKKVPCDDANPCTFDTCKTKDGTCNPLPMGDGTPCSDGDKCTLGEVCKTGKCAAPATAGCDDKKPCTGDSCDASTGCQFKPVANATACDDQSLCTTADACSNGTCLGKKKACDDSLACTADSCDPATANCLFAPFVEGQACDDGNKCTQGEACTKGACGGGTTHDCTDTNPCTLSACDPKTAACVYPAKAPGTVCDDGLLCTDAECINGQCVAQAHTCPCSKASDCNDGNPCTSDACKNGQCSHSAAPVNTVCSDANACTSGDICVGSLCKPGAPVPCNDGKPCTLDTCHALKGCVTLALPQFSICDDGDKCTAAEACGGGTKLGVCFGKSVPCDDLNPCTADSCDPKVGCVFAAKAGCVLSVTFSDIAVQVLAPYCAGCHTYTHAGLVDKPAPVQAGCGPWKYVVPGAPEDSLFYVKLDPSAALDSTCGGKMPKKAPGPGGLDPKVLKLVKDWILGGAKL